MSLPLSASLPTVPVASLQQSTQMIPVSVSNLVSSLQQPLPQATFLPQVTKKMHSKDLTPNAHSSAGACIQSKPQFAPCLYPIRVLTLPSHRAWSHPPPTDLPGQSWARALFWSLWLHVPHRICHPKLRAVKQSAAVLSSQLGTATTTASRKLRGKSNKKELTCSITLFI